MFAQDEIPRRFTPHNDRFSRSVWRNTSLRRNRELSSRACTGDDITETEHDCTIGKETE